MKREFAFTDNDGVKQTDIELFADDVEYYATLLAMKERFYSLHRPLEKKWVKDELAKTDFIHIPDATVDGELISGTSKYDDLMTYRGQLRSYNCTTENRPERPEWFTD